MKAIKRLLAIVFVLSVMVLPFGMVNASAEDTQNSQVATNETTENEDLHTDEPTTYTTQFSVKLSISSIDDNIVGKYASVTSVAWHDKIVSAELIDAPECLAVRVNGGFYEIHGYFNEKTEPFNVTMKVISTDTFLLSTDAEVTDIVTDLAVAPHVPEDGKYSSSTTVPGPDDTKDDSILTDIMNKVDGLVADKKNEGLDAIWEIVRPFVVYVLSALLSGVVLSTIISNLLKKKYDTNEIAKQVTANIANKDISVDLETITRKEISVIGATLKNNLADGLKCVGDMRRAVALLCNALAKSKTLTIEERVALADEAKKIDAEVAEEPKEKVVVRLAKAEEKTVENEPSGLFSDLK